MVLEVSMLYHEIHNTTNKMFKPTSSGGLQLAERGE